MGSGRDRKRRIKAARKIPTEQIRQVLSSDNDLVDDHFLVYERELDSWFICCWSRTNGMMTTTIEDEALYWACVEYMKNHGYLEFKSMREALAYAAAQGWTNSQPEGRDYVS